MLTPLFILARASANILCCSANASSSVISIPLNLPPLGESCTEWIEDIRTNVLEGTHGKNNRNSIMNLQGCQAYVVRMQHKPPQCIHQTQEPGTTNNHIKIYWKKK